MLVLLLLMTVISKRHGELWNEIRVSPTAKYSEWVIARANLFIPEEMRRQAQIEYMGTAGLTFQPLTGLPTAGKPFQP
jgi:hypothetical protein